MPYKKEIAKRKKLPENIWAFLRDELPDASFDQDIFLLREEKLRKLWNESKAAILQDWTLKHPGTRPSLWWCFDAPRWDRKFDAWFDGTLPEPRQRIGGKGTPDYDVLAYVPDFEFGIPTGWIGDFEERHFDSCKGKGIDPNDPPTFESQASYLQRHGLLTEAEKKYLERHPELLEPEKITTPGHNESQRDVETQ